MEAYLVFVTQISPEDLRRRLEQGDTITVVDMRQPWEYEAGHIPGAINIFIQEIPARLHELPRQGEIVFQCWHGVTSMDAAGFAMQNGWAAESVSSLSGGMVGWVETHGQDALVVA
jgi:rhodanese-related sulfurtransferase